MRDIRNLARADLALPADGIAIVGDNGQGKTNVLEAIAYLHLLRSVRGARDADVVRFGAPGGSITGAAVRGGGPAAGVTRTVTVGFDRHGHRKRVAIDGATPERLSDGFGALPSVAIAPSDVDLVRGGPEARRRYLDIVLATTSPAYLAALQRYRSALARRNAVLRDSARRGGARAGSAADAAAAVWEPQLAEAGAIVRGARLAWVARWAGELARLAFAIGERGVVTMRYVARGRTEDATAGAGLGLLREMLAEELRGSRAADVGRGMTHPGPHRDDLVLAIDGRALHAFGSSGQQRTVAIALRLLEARTMRADSGCTPVLLLDDPFAELDEGRARAVLQLVRGGGERRTEDRSSSRCRARRTSPPRWTDSIAGGSLTAIWRARHDARAQADRAAAACRGSDRGLPQGVGARGPRGAGLGDSGVALARRIADRGGHDAAQRDRGWHVVRGRDDQRLDDGAVAARAPDPVRHQSRAGARTRSENSLAGPAISLWLVTSYMMSSRLHRGAPAIRFRDW